MNSFISSVKNSKPLSSLKSMKTYEIVLLVLFIIYIILPINPPKWMASFVESSLGIVTLFCITVALFIYTNPILGVVYILVAYEVFRRSGNVNEKNIYQSSTTTSQTPPQEPTRTTRSIPISQTSKDAQLQLMNVDQTSSLEEEVISVSIPQNENQQKVVDMEYNFLPVADSIISGSSLYV
jgi:uncharacterized membrane protein (DUF485 family)